VIVFWVEASREIGMGHLMECLAIRNKLHSEGVLTHFYINEYEPAEEKLRELGVNYSLLAREKKDNPIGKSNVQKECTTIVVNHHAVSSNTLVSLKDDGWKVCVIDQLGNKNISADLLINYSIVEDWINYNILQEDMVSLFGPEFTLLRGEFEEPISSQKEKKVESQNVLISMGGVDRTGATIRLIEALSTLESNLMKTIVIGAGFAHRDKLGDRKNLGENNFVFKDNVERMSSEMSCADIAISAGGNTLYELAAMGVPTLVLWEDEHERILADSFASRGAVLNIGNGMSTPKKVITDSILSLLSDQARLDEMRSCSMSIVDAKGVNRVCKAILEL
jgi:UDP-2,4-diacetamido-2,4,6-trideoxy-beta-L-altropyranose hydrolase